MGLARTCVFLVLCLEVSFLHVASARAIGSSQSQSFVEYADDVLTRKIDNLADTQVLIQTISPPSSLQSGQSGLDGMAVGQLVSAVDNLRHVLEHTQDTTHLLQSSHAHTALDHDDGVIDLGTLLLIVLLLALVLYGMYLAHRLRKLDKAVKSPHPADDVLAKSTSIVEELKSFYGNKQSIDLAIGLIVGGAFALIVSSLTSDILTPLLAVMIRSKSIDNNFAVLRAGQSGAKSYDTLEEAEKDGAVTLNYGKFTNIVLTFLVTLVSMFALKKLYEWIQSKRHTLEAHIETLYQEHITESADNPEESDKLEKSNKLEKSAETEESEASGKPDIARGSKPVNDPTSLEEERGGARRRRHHNLHRTAR